MDGFAKDVLPKSGGPKIWSGLKKMYCQMDIG